MLKTFLLTVTLATSAFVIGYHGDYIVGKLFEARAYMQGVQADPEKAFWTCWDANANAMVCQAQANALAARVGLAEAAQVTLRGITNRELANYPR